jgi:hypothetical protein
VVRQRGMADKGQCSVRWGLWTRERAKEGGGECGDGWGCSSPFYLGWERDSGSGKGGGMTGVIAEVVNGD